MKKFKEEKNVARPTEKSRTLDKSRGKYPVSVYLELEETEALKALSVAQDISISSVIVSMIRECLSKDEYQTAIQAYRQFKKSLE